MDGASQSYSFDFGEVEVCHEYVKVMKRAQWNCAV